MRILQLCKKFPFPLNDGESIAVTNLAISLKNLGCHLTLLSFNTTKHYTNVENLPESFNHYEAIHTVAVDNKIKPLAAFASLFSKDSFHISRFDTNDFHQALTKVLQEKEFDIIQLESVYMAPYISTIRKHSKAKIGMRAHNIEFEIWERICSNTKNPVKRTILRHLTKKLKRYELSQLSNYDVLATVSERDLKVYRQLGYKNPAINLPIALEVSDYAPVKSFEDRSDHLCFIGSLDWQPNLEGLVWFLKEVFPKVTAASPGTKLHVAGKNAPDWLKTIGGSNVVFEGMVPDAKAFISKHKYMVVPLLSGSGIRVKILEGMALKSVVFSTQIGAEGIDAKHAKEFFLAANADEMADQLVSSLKDASPSASVAKAARSFIEREFDRTIVAQKYLKFLNDVV